VFRFISTGNDRLSQRSLGSASVGRRVEIEAQRGLLGDVQDRELELSGLHAKVRGYLRGSGSSARRGGKSDGIA